MNKRQADTPEEVAQLSSGIDLSLPDCLALAQHGPRHQLIAVLVRDQVGRLEEDAGSLGKRRGRPRRASLESSRDGLLDIGRRGVGILCHGLARRRVGLARQLLLVDMLAATAKRQLQRRLALAAGDGVLQRLAVCRSGAIVVLACQLACLRQ